MWLAKTPRRNPSFSFTTFKDIQRLIKEDEDVADAQNNIPVNRRNKLISILHRVRIARSALRTWACPPALPGPTNKNRIVVYHTSLRVVRKTFDDCRAVQSILNGFRVLIDERDLSMDPGFLEELKGILGNKDLTLPMVFIGGRYVGGAEEIKQLHETGELKNIIQGFPKAEPGVCVGCGGLRFVLCSNCSGSHKCYSDKGGFRTCSVCNENGLVRCPVCC